MKVICEIEQADLTRRFGAATIEKTAAALYAAFHGDCRCTAHPFYFDDAGDFHGTLPWNEGHQEADDNVVQAFRLAAIGAYEALRSTGFGSLT